MGSGFNGAHALITAGSQRMRVKSLSWRAGVFAMIAANERAITTCSLVTRMSTRHWARANFAANTSAVPFLCTFGRSDSGSITGLHRNGRSLGLLCSQLDNTLDAALSEKQVIAANWRAPEVRMVCSPLRTQTGSRACGNRSPICGLFKGVQTCESAQPIRYIDVEKAPPNRRLPGNARDHGAGEVAREPGVGGAGCERGKRQAGYTGARA